VECATNNELEGSFYGRLCFCACISVLQFAEERIALVVSSGSGTYQYVSVRISTYSTYQYLPETKSGILKMETLYLRKRFSIHLLYGQEPKIAPQNHPHPL
jgi:hypothetical protein